MERLLPFSGPAGKLTVLSMLALLNILSAPLGHSQKDPIYLWCSGYTNYTAGSEYKANLDLLLSNLSAVPASAGGGHFLNASVGYWTDPDAVYGLVQCRGDVLAADCAFCLNRSASAAVLRCPLRRRAAVRFDYCLLRFSDQKFFGNMDDTERSSLVNSKGAPDPLAFDHRLMDLMAEISSQAAAASSKFAVGINNSDSSGIYGLVQCTHDLSESECSQCLQGQISILPRGKIGAQIHVASCSVRFETSIFFATLAISPPPPLQNRSLRSPGNDAGVSSGGKENTCKSWRIIMIIVILLLVAVIVLLLVLLIHFRRRIPKGLPLNLVKDQEVITAESLLFDFRTLKIATRNFSEANKLGEGGFGPVYKGLLPDGQQIAVKRLSKRSGQGLAELRNEVVLVAKLQHRNLVRLLGFCLEEEEKMVIYEYLPNRSLDNFLFDPIKRHVLDWERRYKLIEGIARGLVYLHEDSRLRVIHRDLKASNVLLDENMNPKISDFGLAKLFGMDETHRNTSRIAGTHGYMAPEYVIRGHFSPKLDVFSFGILTLEIVTGQRNNIVSCDSENPIDLVSYVWHHWNEGTTLEVVDQSIADQCPRHEVIRCIHMGLLCIQSDPSDRPNMSEVALMLSSFSVTLLAPSKPAFVLNSSMRSQSEESRIDTDYQSSERHNSNQSIYRPSGQSINEVTFSGVEPR
ncbi:unnamed protein product [Spirodela intermedia]|uniref:Uncharacterized protein n=1 Tax=Spirodela intermedia TaxID=51605 RepID=A0A7I8K4L5_SPIIN|nr:unnamed protein product [Spirodela intermedia]